MIVDFDSCMAFGEPLVKGVASGIINDKSQPISARENDLQGLAEIKNFLFPTENPPPESYADSTMASSELQADERVSAAWQKTLANDGN